MTIKPHQLESIQSYHARGKFGFPPMNITREEPQGFKCALCLEVDVKDEGDYCPECQTADDEFFADQRGDR